MSVEGKLTQAIAMCMKLLSKSTQTHVLGTVSPLVKEATHFKPVVDSVFRLSQAVTKAESKIKHH